MQGLLAAVVVAAGLWRWQRFDGVRGQAWRHGLCFGAAMMGRLLQGVGVLAVLGTFGLGVSALLIVREHVQIVVTDSADADPMAIAIALLRDDVRALDARLAGSAQGLGDHIQRGLESVDAAAAARAAETATRLLALDELRSNAAATARRLDQFERALAALPRAGTVREMAAAAPLPAAVTPADVATAPTAVPAAPPPTLAADPDAAVTAAPRARFLSFRLPARAIAFDRAQRFVVVPELSRVGFDAKSTLHDFSGVTSSVRGELQAMLGDAAGSWRGAVACTAATLATGVDGRDEAMHEHLGSKTYADVTFRIAGFTPDAGGLEAAARRVRGIVRGTMTIRGVDRELAMPVRLCVDDGQRLVVEGETALRLPDHGVRVPSQLGVIGMEPEVRIWVALRLRLVGDGT